MAQVSYEKLWNKLKENNMHKTDLYRKVKISTNAIAKMGKKSAFLIIRRQFTCLKEIFRFLLEVFIFCF